ncbi:peptidyl-prolyl cis-trans isomerase [Paraclostridium bifermentans]|nr:peptidylprolyl isomerase [Bacillus sp. BAU-SS-2023]GKZ02469.1 peptidyl-prolyl cis-trans isomerase [Paraclostridium bifermentans]GKZ06307.1 peptidyl-prolyl cis-trans isomerase [Paraclostridium bifermentans]GKZ08885.1 peptidyl-prolyl cis-trans isomerase [Paraclostridium bifermentans]
MSTDSNFLSKMFKCFGGSKKEFKNEIMEAPNELPIAYIDVENIGVIEAELYPHIAPNTVNNFIYLANNNFYDNLTFHRIVKNFVIQGGCPEGSGMGGPGYSIEGEFNKNNFRNDLKHTEGVLSMARSQSKNSGGSQFFIITKSAPHLNGKYAGFGKVINGMDLVYKIEDLGSKGTLFVIKSIKIDTKGETYNEPIKYK